MKGYEHLVRVTDKEGRAFVCKLDCEAGSKSNCSWDNEWENPSRFEELSEHERNSCMRVG